MEITIMSRADAEAYSRVQLDHKVAIISINSVEDDRKTYLSSNENIIDVLHLEFDDYNFKSPTLMTINDAKQRVFPAASPLQLERMRVLRLNTNDLKCIAFGTDGFTDKYLRPHTSGFDGYGLHEVFKINNDEEFEELVKNKHSILYC